MGLKDKKIICHDINNKEVAISADHLSFRPSVYGLLIENGRILLSQQRGGYDFPGGGVNIDETVAEALVREFFEETGLRVKPGQVVDCQTSFYDSSGSGPYWNCPMVYFLVEKLGGELSINYLDEEEKFYTDMPEWIDLKDLDVLKFFNSVDSPGLIRRADKMKKLFESVS